MTTQVRVSYVLSLPDGTNAPSSLALNGVHTFVVDAEKTASIGKYYEALRQSIAAAKGKVGAELTAWRDAAGNVELGKEKAAKAARAEEDEDEGSP